MLTRLRNVSCSRSLSGISHRFTCHALPRHPDGSFHRETVQISKSSCSNPDEILLTPFNLKSTPVATLKRVPLSNTGAQLDWLSFLAAFFL